MNEVRGPVHRIDDPGIGRYPLFEISFLSEYAVVGKRPFYFGHDSALRLAVDVRDQIIPAFVLYS